MNIKSQATIYYSYDLEGTSFKNVSTSNTLLTPLRVASFQAKKIANATYFKPGDIITYTIIVNNASNFKVNNISIKDLIINQTFIKDSFHYYYLNDTEKDVNLEISEERLDFTINELAPSSVCIISYKTKAKEDLELYEELQNRSVISIDEAKNATIDDFSLTQRFAKVICEKSISNDFAYLNSNLTYKIIVKNIGNFEARNIEIIDQLPETFHLLNSSPIYINDIEFNNFTYDNDKCILTIPWEILEPLEEITILITGSIIK